MMIHKISHTVDYNQWLILLDTELGVKKLEDSLIQNVFKKYFLMCSLQVYECFFLGREWTLGCLLYWSLKFYNNVFLLVGVTTLLTFVIF